VSLAGMEGLQISASPHESRLTRHIIYISSQSLRATSRPNLHFTRQTGRFSF